MTTKTFGVRADGTLGVCRAKPENRGKGNCDHSEHVELTEKQLTEGFLRLFNENAVQNFFQKNGQEAWSALQKRKKVKLTLSEKAAFNPDVLEEESNKVAHEIRNEDFHIVKEFYEKYERAMNALERTEYLDGDPAEKLYEYLQSDDATKMRDYLGEQADLKALSELLYDGVGAMTNRYTWSSSGRNSIPRSFLSNLRNDMTKENYVTSVLFFKGNCCYCDRPLRKGGQKETYQASGEHLTPVWPDDENQVVGGTRFGNMALACKRCNGSRGSNDLTTWINGTDSLKKAQKPAALGRIKAFREFTNYHEFTQEESDSIRSALRKIQNEADEIRLSVGYYPKGMERIIRQRIEDEIAKFEAKFGDT